MQIIPQSKQEVFKNFSEMSKLHRTQKLSKFIKPDPYTERLQILGSPQISLTQSKFLQLEKKNGNIVSKSSNSGAILNKESANKIISDLQDLVIMKDQNKSYAPQTHNYQERSKSQSQLFTPDITELFEKKRLNQHSKQQYEKYWIYKNLLSQNINPQQKLTIQQKNARFLQFIKQTNQCASLEKMFTSNQIQKKEVNSTTSARLTFEKFFKQNIKSMQRPEKQMDNNNQEQNINYLNLKPKNSIQVTKFLENNLI